MRDECGGMEHRTRAVIGGAVGAGGVWCVRVGGAGGGRARAAGGAAGCGGTAVPPDDAVLALVGRRGRAAVRRPMERRAAGAVDEPLVRLPTLRSPWERRGPGLDLSADRADRL